MRALDLSLWTITETPSTPGERPGRSVRAKCHRCTSSIYTWLPEGVSVEAVLRDHDSQHLPGRARDISVEWSVIAHCSVCEEGGDVNLDSDGDLLCEECGTCWSMDGTGGTLADPED